MAALTHPTNDDHGSASRLVEKFFTFTTAVNTGDTFDCPMADIEYAYFVADGATAVSSSIQRGTSANGVTPLTIRLSASSTGTIVAKGIGV
jgi:hypothetical protein